MVGLLRELLWSQSYLWNGFCLLTTCDHSKQQGVSHHFPMSFWEPAPKAATGSDGY